MGVYLDPVPHQIRSMDKSTASLSCRLSVLQNIPLYEQWQSDMHVCYIERDSSPTCSHIPTVPDRKVYFTKKLLCYM